MTLAIPEKSVITYITRMIDKDKEAKRLGRHLEKIFTKTNNALFFDNLTCDYIECGIEFFMEELQLPDTSRKAIKSERYSVLWDKSFVMITINYIGDTGAGMLSKPEYVCGRNVIGYTFIMSSDDWDFHKQAILRHIDMDMDEKTDVVNESTKPRSIVL